MNIKLADESLKDKWNGFVKEHGSVFHLWEWRYIYEKSYGYKPLYLAAFENDKIVGILPAFILGKLGGKRIISIPYADYAGPVSINEKISSLLIKTFVEKYNEQNCRSIQLFSSGPVNNIPLQTFKPFCRFTLSGQNNYDDVVKNTIHQKTRNMINKFERSGVSIEIVKKPLEQIEAYYKIYAKTMQKLSKPPHTLFYFKEIIKNLREDVKLFFAKYNNNVVAGLLALYFRNTLHIWGNASDERYKHLAGNIGVYAYTIKYACENKIPVIDFGSTLLNSSHYFFKQRWGGKELPIYLFSNKEINNNKSSSFKILGAFCRWFPAQIVNKTSEWLYKYY